MVAVLIWNLLLSLSFGRARVSSGIAEAHVVHPIGSLAKPCSERMEAAMAADFSPWFWFNDYPHRSRCNGQSKALPVQERLLLTRKEAGIASIHGFPFPLGSKGDNST